LKHFNIRVYAIIEDGLGNILISDEYYNDTRITKFPGGGLEFGEGTIDCLKREALEEFEQEIEVTGHFYTTDFFQKALFFEDHQLISIYYKARFKESPRFFIADKPFDFELRNGHFSFRWVSVSELRTNDMTFPIDKVVAGMLAQGS
jgi:8-oxo-dGTP diphosphatase